MEEAIYEEDQKTIKDWLHIFNRRKVEFLIFFIPFLVISILVAKFIPAVYRSSATILIKQQEIPQDMVRSTITTFVEQRLYQINTQVLSSTNLWKIIERRNLYAERLKTDPRELVIGRMRDDIGFELISEDIIDPRSGRASKASIAFKISYDNRSSRSAFLVASDLTQLYLAENIEERTQLAEDAREFLSYEEQRILTEIRQLESELAVFKEQNADLLPEMTQLNFQKIDRSERDLVEVNRQIQALRERQIYLSSQLTQLNPYAVLYSDTGERIMSPADRLEALQTQKIGLETVYSSEHPDIRRLNREINALEAEVGGSDIATLHEELAIHKNELAKVQQRYANTHPDVKRLQDTIHSIQQTIDKKMATKVPKSSVTRNASNPAYVQLATQLKAADSELASLISKQQGLKTKIIKLEQNIALSPRVEEKYRELARDHEHARLRHQELKSKLFQAELGEVLEAGSKGERFIVNEPALQSERPVFPNRPAIFLMGTLLGLAGAFGFILVRENLDDSVRSADDILTLVGMRPLAAIPAMLTLRDYERIKLRQIQYSLAVGVVVVVGILLVHLFYKPLDVLWFVSLRKLGAM